MTDHQTTIDFESAFDELLQGISDLEMQPLDMSLGRIRGVTEFLTRVLLLSKRSSQPMVRLGKSMIAAGIQGRKRVSEKTVQRWGNDAIQLGLVERIVYSHEFGGPQWNGYLVHWHKLKQIRAAAPLAAPATLDSHPDQSTPAATLDSRLVKTGGPAALDPPPPSGPIRGPLDSPGLSGNPPAKPPDPGGHGWTRVDMVSTPGVDTMSTPNSACLKGSNNLAACFATAQRCTGPPRKASSENLVVSKSPVAGRAPTVAEAGKASETRRSVAGAAKASDRPPLQTAQRPRPTDIEADLRKRGWDDRAIMAAADIARRVEGPTWQTILRTYDYHASRFRSSGAIWSRVRDGCWPVRGITDITPAMVAARRDRELRKRVNDTIERIRYTMRGRTEEAIESEIRRAIPAELLQLYHEPCIKSCQEISPSH